MFDEMDRAFRQNEENRLSRQQQYRESSRDKLRKFVETRIRTTFIGSLDSIEKYLGILWNHGQNDVSKLTSSQKYYRKLWKQLRNDILDKGQDQLDLSQSVFDEYTITWDKKTYKFTFQELKDE